MYAVMLDRLYIYSRLQCERHNVPLVGMELLSKCRVCVGSDDGGGGDGDGCDNNSDNDRLKRKSNENSKRNCELKDKLARLHIRPVASFA